MIFGGLAFAEAPYTGNPTQGTDFIIFIDLELIIPASLVFFGEIGDVVILPPDLNLTPSSLNDRLSPCVLYDN